MPLKFMSIPLFSLKWVEVISGSDYNLTIALFCGVGARQLHYCYTKIICKANQNKYCRAWYQFDFIYVLNCARIVRPLAECQSSWIVCFKYCQCQAFIAVEKLLINLAYRSRGEYLSYMHLMTVLQEMRILIRFDAVLQTITYVNVKHVMQAFKFDTLFAVTNTPSELYMTFRRKVCSMYRTLSWMKDTGLVGQISSIYRTKLLL